MGVLDTRKVALYSWFGLHKLSRDQFLTKDGTLSNPENMGKEKFNLLYQSQLKCYVDKIGHVDFV